MNLIVIWLPQIRISYYTHNNSLYIYYLETILYPPMLNLHSIILLDECERDSFKEKKRFICIRVQNYFYALLFNNAGKVKERRNTVG